MIRAVSFRIRRAFPILFLAAGLACSGKEKDAGKDPLTAELDRASSFLESKPATQRLWAQVKQSNQPVLERARADLSAGRRELALQRAGTVRMNLALSTYLSERSGPQRKETAAFDAEWKRMGEVLRDDLGKPDPAEFDGAPAAARALGEVALPQIRAFYEASLEQGHNTTLDEGLFYLASAESQHEVADFYRTFTEPSASSPRREPPLRSIRPEIDDLEGEVLRAYRPPLSIDRHGDFIGISSTLKEARELDASGLRYGALLRYLQAAQRFAPLRPAGPALAADALAGRLNELDTRLSAGDVDHSLGRLFLELARAEVAGAPQGASPAPAVALAVDVLPRYFAALEPARPEAPKPEPLVTVTLVRWPYT